MTADECLIPEVTEDRLLDGRVRLLQPRRGHRAGLDAVLLAEAADMRAGDHLVDLGSASGAVGLMVARLRPGIRLTLVDRDPHLAALARRNLALNGLDGQGAVIEADLFGDRASLRAAGLAAGTADAVVTNPPFFDAGARASPEAGRAGAHVMRGGDLAGWLAAAAWLLRPDGRLWLIHRADALAACLAALAPACGSVAITPVHSKTDGPATRILVTARKGGRAPLRIERPVDLAGPGATDPAG